MDLWMTYSVDYYDWIFYGEYLVGGISPDVLSLTPRFYRLIQDAFGTYLIIDLIAAANLKTPFLAAPAISATMLLWCSTAVYCLIKKTFSLKTWLSLALTLGAVSGSLFNYIGLIGMFGHLVAMTAYLVALEQTMPDFGSVWPQAQLKRRLFIPVFIIFLSYQAGYVMYSGLIVLAGILLAFLSHKNLRVIKRAAKAVFTGAKPIIIITFISGLLMPQVFSHIFSRSLEVAAQTLGWKLPFFSPWLFSGIPYYSPEALDPTFPSELDLSPLAYLPLVALVIGLLIIVVRLPQKRPAVHNPNPEPTETAAILSLTGIFLISVASYLLLYVFGDHSYKVWKFAAYTVLPLSFVPTALFISALTRFPCQNRQYLPTAAVIIAAIFIGKNFLAMLPLNDVASKYFDIVSVEGFIADLKSIRNNTPFEKIILFDFDNPVLGLISAIIYGNNLTYKAYFTSYMYFMYGKIDNFNIISENLIIITNKNFENIINSSKYTNNLYHINQYDYGFIKALGYVSLKNGTLSFNWQTGALPIHATFLVPENKIGRNLNFKVSLDLQYEISAACQKGRLGVVNSQGEIIWSEHNIDRLSTPIPADLIGQKIIRTVFEVRPIQKESALLKACQLKIKSIILD
jgi:hypothetical protein